MPTGGHVRQDPSRLSTLDRVHHPIHQGQKSPRTHLSEQHDSNSRTKKDSMTHTATRISDGVGLLADKNDLIVVPELETQRKHT